MVEGLTTFRDRFAGFEDCYVLIGGTACDLWMGGDDARKHRNDVFRLLVTLAPADRFDLADAIRADLAEFVMHFATGGPDWAAIQQAVNQGQVRMPGPRAAIQQLRDNFRLD